MAYAFLVEIKIGLIGSIYLSEQAARNGLEGKNGDFDEKRGKNRYKIEYRELQHRDIQVRSYP